MISYYEKILATGEVKCIDEEIPFEIPQGWEWVKLRSITSLLGDGIHGTPEYDNNGSFFFINGNNLKEKSIIIKPDTKKVNEKEYLKYKKDLNETTVLVSINGTLGNIAFYNDEPVMLGKSACYFNLIFKQLKDYIYLVLNSPYFLEYALSAATGTTIKNVSLQAMNNLLIPFPSTTEQCRIVNKIELLSPILGKYSKQEIKLNRLNGSIKQVLKKSVLQEAIQGRLVSQKASEEPASILLQRIKEEKQRLVKEGKLKKKDLAKSVIYKGDDNKYYERIGKQCKDITEEIPFEINLSWQWVRLSCVADIYTGNSISETEKKTRFTNVVGRYYIGTKDVGFDNIISYNNGVAIPKQYEHDFKIAPNHSILMCIEGGSAGRKIAILNQDVCFGNKLCCFSPFIKIEKYIYYYLQSQSFIDMFKANKTGIIGGVSIAKIKEMLIPLPPIAEQQRIVAQIERLFEQLK